MSKYHFLEIYWTLHLEELTNTYTITYYYLLLLTITYLHLDEQESTSVPKYHFLEIYWTLQARRRMHVSNNNCGKRQN